MIIFIVFARVAELVDARDSKSRGVTHESSILSSGTTNELKGFLEAQRWDALRASHLWALKKPLSSFVVHLFDQIRNLL